MILNENHHFARWLYLTDSGHHNHNRRKIFLLPSTVARIFPDSWWICVNHDIDGHKICNNHEDKNMFMTANRIKLEGKPLLKLNIHEYNEEDIPFLDSLGIDQCRRRRTKLQIYPHLQPERFSQHPFCNPSEIHGARRKRTKGFPGSEIDGTAHQTQDTYWPVLCLHVLGSHDCRSEFSMIDPGLPKTYKKSTLLIPKTQTDISQAAQVGDRINFPNCRDLIKTLF